MNIFHFSLTLLVITIMQISQVNSHWWYLGLKSLYSNNNNTSSNRSISSINNNNVINSLSYFNKRIYCNDANILTSSTQRKLCNSNIKVLQILTDAAAMAIKECQTQFKYKRWNCTVYNNSNVYGRLLNTKSRETAFIYAINSAAVMYRVTQACTKGELKKCGCDQTVQRKKLSENYEWGGCSHNVFFGHRFSKKFVDSSEMKLKFNDRLMNLHNNEVGRRTILKNMKQVCKCHGVSGSCSMKICWQIMPDFRVVGDELVKNFNEATPVRVDKQNIVLKVKKTRSTVSTGNLKRKPRKDDLVFIQRSPNFCEKNLNVGSIGTTGRRCVLLPKTLTSSNNSTTTNKTKRQASTETCSNLCCGRGYRTKVVEIEEDCDCQFQWCCSVKCKKCRKRIIEYYCN